MKTARNVLALIALVTGLLLPFAAWAGNDNNAVGVLKPDGYVTVNERRVTQTTTLFSGDNVKCGPNSSAWIVRSGELTRVPNRSEASFHEGKFRVMSYKHNDKDDKDAERHERERHECKEISPSHPKHHDHDRDHNNDRDHDHHYTDDDRHDSDCDD